MLTTAVCGSKLPLQREPRQQWLQGLTLMQAKDMMQGKESIYYSPTSCTWVIVPDSDAEHVPDSWVHVGR